MIVEMKAGRIPKPPAVYGNRVPMIDFLGPLAQAQRKLFQGRGIMAALEQSAPIWERAPEVMDKINLDVVQEYIFASNNFPAKAVRNDDEVAVIRENRAQQQQAQMQQEQALNSSMVMEKMTKADKNTGGKITEELEAAE
jgi:hypothetical protein